MSAILSRWRFSATVARLLARSASTPRELHRSYHPIFLPILRILKGLGKLRFGIHGHGASERTDVSRTQESDPNSTRVP